MNSDPINTVPNQQISTPIISQPTVAQMPVVPSQTSTPSRTTTPIPSPSSSNSKTMIMAFVGIGLLVLIVVLAAVFIPKFLISNKSGLSTRSSRGAIPSKYASDIDSDSIPDVLETELGLNPSVSEFTRCQPDLCGSSDASQAQAIKNNVLIIIDSSGSMNITIGGKTKMDLAKEAVRNFLKSTASNVNVGVMVYGHKGSNSPIAKAESCASAEVVAPIGSVTSASVDGYLATIKPVGWTPIGLSIRKAKDAFIGKEGQKNQIIVVTDGAETCNSNPVGAAAEAKSSPYQIQVDVIGFAVNSSEQSALQAISVSGGGLFSVAVNADQLLSQMQASHANFEKFQSSASCTVDVYQKSITCLQDVQNKTFSYLSTVLNGKKGTEYQELSNLQLSISKLYSNKVNILQDQWRNALNANQRILK